MKIISFSDQWACMADKLTWKLSERFKIKMSPAFFPLNVQIDVINIGFVTRNITYIKPTGLGDFFNEIEHPA